MSGSSCAGQSGAGERGGEPPRAPLGASEIADALRQMIAVLEAERHALAALDADGLITAAQAKEALCHALEQIGPDLLDEATRPLAETARRLNEVNRQVRNLLAANVAARLKALGRFEDPGALRLPAGRFGDGLHKRDARAGYGPAS